MRTKFMTLTQSWLVVAGVTSLIGCNQASVSTSGDVAVPMAQIRALSSTQTSPGCFEDVFRVHSDVAGTDADVDFTLKSNWQGKVDLGTVHSDRREMGDGCVDIHISYCHLAPPSDCSSNSSDEGFGLSLGIGIDLEHNHPGDNSDDQDELHANILVCHVPDGNPSHAHEILVSWDGWIHGHSHHGEDHLGACNENPPTDPSSGSCGGNPGSGGDTPPTDPGTGGTTDGGTTPPPTTPTTGGGAWQPGCSNVASCTVN